MALFKKMDQRIREKLDEHEIYTAQELRKHLDTGDQLEEGIRSMRTEELQQTINEWYREQNKSVKEGKSSNSWTGWKKWGLYAGIFIFGVALASPEEVDSRTEHTRPISVTIDTKKSEKKQEKKEQEKKKTAPIGTVEELEKTHRENINGTITVTHPDGTTTTAEFPDTGKPEKVEYNYPGTQKETIPDSVKARYTSKKDDDDDYDDDENQDE